MMGGDLESGGAGISVGPVPIPKVDGAMFEVAWSTFDTLCRVRALSGAFGAADDCRGSRSDCLRGIHTSAVIEFVCLMLVFLFQSPL
jgi:hypothetical protein